MGTKKRKRFEAIDGTRRYVRAADALCKSDSDMKGRICKTLDMLLLYPESPGLHREPIISAKVEDMHSSRVDRGTRLIDREISPSRLCALNVGPHNPMYQWSKRHDGAGDDDVAETIEPAGGDTGALEAANPAAAGEAPLQDCTLPSGIKEDAARGMPIAGPGEESFDCISLAALLELGLPRWVAKRVRQTSTRVNLTDYGFPDALEDAIIDLYDQHSCDASPGIEATESRRPSFVPIPVPRFDQTDDDDDVVVTITEPGQFERMAEIGLDRYLMVLTDEQRQLAEIDARGLTVIKGPAGSGKTTVAVHRLKFLADRIQRQPALLGTGPQRVLYLCYNSALARVVEQMVATLYCGQCPDCIRVRTLHAWAKEYLVSRGVLMTSPRRKTEGRYWRVDGDGTVSGLVKRRLKGASGERVDPLWLRLVPQFFEDEVKEIILGRGVVSLEEYLAADRRGRRVALSVADRRLIWHLYEEYRQSLESRHLLDFATLPSVAREYLRQDTEFVPYEAVVVDEVQDFTPLYMRLANELTGRRSEHLTFFGDAAQTLYRTGFSWKHAELTLHSRHIHALKSNLRNTREIALAASALIQGDKSVDDRESDDRELFLPERSGPPPTILVCADSATERTELSHRIRAQLDTGVPPQNIAVLCGTNPTVERITQKLLATGIPAEALRRSGQRAISIVARSVKVLTMHSAKGLDFPHVYLADVTMSGLPGKSADGEDNVELRDMQRRLLYTSMCRAGQTLTLSTISGQEHPLLAEFPASLCPCVPITGEDELGTA